MKRAVLAAALAGSLVCSTAALAQHGRHHGGYHGGHGHGGYAWVGPGPRYYYPYSVYTSPLYIAPYYPAPVYVQRAPVVVQRYYVEEAPRAPQPPQYSREERSYAQSAPPQPQRPAPRFERMTLSAKELFAFDEAQLHAPQPRLDQIADAMRQNPEIDQVSITGYTDRIGTESYNARLSQRRADAVRAYLVGKGVEGKRLVAIGKGESNPVVQCNDRKMADLVKCLEPNRRVEVEEIVIERRVRDRG